MPDPHVWLLDDDDDLRPALVQSLQLDGFQTTEFGSGPELLERLKQATETGGLPDIIVSDIRMPQLDGMEVLPAVQRIDPRLPVILMTGHGDVPLAVDAMRAGASDFIEKPFDAARLTNAITTALPGQADTEEHIAPLPLLGPSPTAQELRHRFAHLRRLPGGLLLIGPTGSGHTRLLTHLLAPFERDGRPVVTVNCANLSPDTAEIEMLGDRGVLAAARGGALVLETVTLLPGDVLQQLADQSTLAEAPTIFATIAASFRIDPVLRSIFADRTFELPPLSKRREDITTMFLALVRHAADRFHTQLPAIAAGLEDWLVNQPWEGNIAELQNLAERFVLGSWTLENKTGSSRLADRIAAHERVLIEAELERNKGRIKPTYESLGLSRKGLYDKMKKYGILTGDKG